ncbi:MAG: lamin tail domain-containing protein [Deltaproteobacteria bacterium]|nr:lamin tail domain-containing protein [Deltaproteobacteria bacterium]
MKARSALALSFSYALASGALASGCSDDPTGTGDGDTTSGDTNEVTPDTTDATDTVDTVDTTDTNVADTADTLEDTVDTAIADTTPADTTPPVPEPDVVVDQGLCSPAGGSLNVYDLQNPDCPDHPSPEPVGTGGIAVEIAGLVLTGTFGDTFTAQDPRGGPYSGITIFNHGLYSAEAKVGDKVDIEGNYSEYFENTQIYLTKMTFNGKAPVPAPYVAAHPAHLATNGPLAEMFEGVLCQVRDIYTTHTQPDCPKDYGEFEVTGRLRIDDLSRYRWDARLGDHFASITGPLLFTFGNHKIEPRGVEDFDVIQPGNRNAISKCIATECRAPEDAITTGRVVINEIMADPNGDDTNQEWIELYNPGTEAINLNGWVLRDCGDQAVVLSGPDAKITAKGYLVVGMTKDQDDNGGVPVGFEYGLNGFYLSNTVGSVLLYDGEGLGASLVDQTRYSRFDPWTVFVTGKSIERKGPTTNGTQPGSWASGAANFGDNGNKGTPGKRNSAN